MFPYLYPRVIQYFKSRESFIVIHNEHLVYKILKDKKYHNHLFSHLGAYFFSSMFRGGAHLIKQDTWLRISWTIACKTIIRFEKISISFTVSKQVAVSKHQISLAGERFLQEGLVVPRYYTSFQNNFSSLSVLRREREQRSGKSKVLCTFAESEMSSQNGDRYSNSPARIKSKSSSWSGLKWKMILSTQN